MTSVPRNANASRRLKLAPLGIKFDLTNVATDSGILFAGWNDAGSDVPCNLTHGNFDFYAPIL